MSEVKLLPLPKVLFNVNIEAATYARANVAHAIAPLQAEIEALRAEVERSERYAEQSERERLWAEARAERLAEALRECIELIDTLTPLEGDTMRKARAALRDHDQEDRND